METKEKKGLKKRKIIVILCVSVIAGLFLIGTAGAHLLDTTINSKSSNSIADKNVNTDRHLNGPRPPRPIPDNFTYIIIIPMLLKLDINVTYKFAATTYDVKGNIITGLVYNWCVRNCPPPPKNDTHPLIGIIDNDGNFMAKANGLCNVIAETDYNGTHIIGHAFVQIGILPSPPPPPDGNGTMPPPPPLDGSGTNPPPLPPDGGKQSPIPPPPPRH